MIYFELQLDGKTRVYEQSDRLFLARLRLLAEAEALPSPLTMAEAHDYARAGCFQLEMFTDLEEAGLGRNATAVSGPESFAPPFGAS